MSSEPPAKPPGRLSVARELASLTTAALDPDIAAHVLVARVERFLGWLKAGAPPKPKPAPKVKTPEQLAAEEAKRRAATTTERTLVEDLWLFWQLQTRKTWTLTPERRGKLLACLRAGNSPAKIEAAIKGMMATPHNNGTSKGGDGQMWIDAEILVRNLDRFADVGGYREGGAPTAPGTRQTIAKLEKEKADALRDGDAERFEALRDEIASLSAGGGS